MLKKKSLLAFKLILAFQGGLVCVILGCFEDFLDDPYMNQTTTVVYDIYVYTVITQQEGVCLI